MRARSPSNTALTVVIALVLAACTGGQSADDQATSTTMVEATETTAPTTTSEDTDEELLTATDAVAAAVDAIAAAGTYVFEAKMLLSLQNDEAEVEIEGWVDGSDRELVMTIDQQTVTTRVIDGVATVERDGETVEVPLQEAGTAPSINILKSIQNATFQPENEITGELNASDLTRTDFEVKGSSAVTVYLTSTGALAGYSLLAHDESWSVDVTFSDIGEAPNR